MKQLMNFGVCIYLDWCFINSTVGHDMNYLTDNEHRIILIAYRFIFK